MTAATSASAPARRAATPARPAGAPVSRPAPAARASVAFDDHEDEFRINVSDIPRMRESMEVDGLKPSFLSRLLDLVAPLKS